MPGGETHYAPFLTSWLNGTTGEHSDKFKNELVAFIMGNVNEPMAVNPAGGSENLFILKQGCRHVARALGWKRGPELDLLISQGDVVVNKRLKHWRDEDGLWGVEQLSPIYWIFQFLGHAAMFYHTKNLDLRKNLVESFGSYIYYQGLTYQGDDVVNPGMRGTGWSNPVDPGIKFLVDRNQSLPKYLKHLKSDKCMNFLALCRDIRKPWGLKEPWHIAYINGLPVASWIEKDVNVNTPARMAVRYQPNLAIMPNNFHVHYRQHGKNQRVSSIVTNGNLFLKYVGSYENLDGYHPEEGWWQWQGVPYTVETWSMTGMKRVDYPVNAQEGPSGPPIVPSDTTPLPNSKKPSWIERTGL